MAIVSHTVETYPQSTTRINATYTFTDHIGGTTVVRKVVANSFDTEADALSMYGTINDRLALVEINEAIAVAEQWQNPDKVPEFQSQAVFDRRVLGRLMTYSDAQIFYAGLPHFQAMELRGGPNAAARAAYLGVVQSEYDDMASRFGDVQGIGFFLDDDKNNIWEPLPEDWN